MKLKKIRRNPIPHGKEMSITNIQKTNSSAINYAMKED